MKSDARLCAALLLVSFVSPPADAFIPNSFLAYFANIAGRQQTPITHQAMTRSAILHAAADLMKEYPCDQQSTQRVTNLGSESVLEIHKLIEAYRGKGNQIGNLGRSAFFLATIYTIEVANSALDKTRR